MIPTPAQATETHETPQGPCAELRYRITREMSNAVTTDRAKAVIRCAFRRFAPGEVSMALTISYRESRWNPFAWNHWSNCRGLFQHLQTYWPGRVTAYLDRRWFPNTWPNVSAFDARASAIVAAKMVARSGWGAWSTA
jgi:hypothetical protein